MVVRERTRLSQRQPLPSTLRVDKKFGGVDVLVNNAQCPFEVNPLHEISGEGFKEAMSGELSALYNCTPVFLPGMIEKKVVRTSPTLSTKGPYPFERLDKAYDLVKQIKQLIDPNNILNPGALY
ncbi:MAG: SDR family NAD(P)-dependent oxidoreductase [Candidatus Binatia bacterium]